LPLPILIVSVANRNELTVTGGGNGLLSWMTRLAEAAAPRVDPGPGDDNDNGMTVSLIPGLPLLRKGIVMLALGVSGPKVIVWWNAATSGPPGLDTTTDTVAESLPARVRRIRIEPSVTFAVNCVPEN